jgi:hypothetical protein
MADDDKTQEQQRKAGESLLEHVRVTAQVAGQETKTPYQSGAELDGVYTVQESRDRAAHIPPLHEREGPTPKEMERDLKEYDSWAKSQGRDTWGEGLNEKDVDGLHKQEEAKSAKGGKDGMTPEQQERVDQSLKNANVQRESMGGASDVSNKPTPNDPSSMDKAREVGQDLNKSGVTMDKE